MISQIGTSTLPKLTLNDTDTAYFSEIKSLGVHISLTLNWEKRMNGISKLICYSLNSLRHFRNLLPKSVKVNLTQSLIFSRFDYGALFLSSIKWREADKLQRLNDCCVRFSSGSIHYFDHITPYRISQGGYRRLHDVIILPAALHQSSLKFSNPPISLIVQFLTPVPIHFVDPPDVPDYPSFTNWTTTLE